MLRRRVAFEVPHNRQQERLPAAEVGDRNWIEPASRSLMVVGAALTALRTIISLVVAPRFSSSNFVLMGGRFWCGEENADKISQPGVQPACGAIAQLGERIVRNDEVVGSIPTSSTIFSTTCGGMVLAASALPPWGDPTR